MSIDEKIACGINVLFGAAVGFGFYAIGLWWLLASRNGHWWNGWGAFLLCVGLGGQVGYLTYKNRLKHLDPNSSSGGIYSGQAGGMLLWRRLAVIGGAAVAFYFL